MSTGSLTREEAAGAAFREHAGSWGAKPSCSVSPVPSQTKLQCQLKEKFKGPRSTFTEEAKKGEVGAESAELVIGTVCLFADSASVRRSHTLNSCRKTTKETISA